MMLELRNPIPVLTPLGEGMVLYVESGGPMGNDLWLVALDSGEFRHFLTSDCVSVGNGTFGIHGPRREVEEPRSAVAAAAQKMAGVR